VSERDVEEQIMRGPYPTGGCCFTKAYQVQNMVYLKYSLKAVLRIIPLKRLLLVFRYGVDRKHKAQYFIVDVQIFRLFYRIFNGYSFAHISSLLRRGANTCCRCGIHGYNFGLASGCQILCFQKNSGILPNTKQLPLKLFSNLLRVSLVRIDMSQ
jgi:hypothetical protein